MKLGLIVHQLTLRQFHQARECSLSLHHLKRMFMVFAVKEKESSDHVQSRRIVFLEKGEE
jgi:hypothetical protein